MNYINQLTKDDIRELFIMLTGGNGIPDMSVGFENIEVAD